MQQQGSLEDDGGNCTEHSDCSFFDCQGECDKIAGKCRDQVANNNLQVNAETLGIHHSKLKNNNLNLMKNLVFT